MTAPEAIVVELDGFAPVKANEALLEKTIATSASSLFPGYDYYDFKPAIPCGDSTRHPDGVLLSEDSKEWWVIEVETHLHPVDAHIEPQLKDLSGGFYGPEPFSYLERFPKFKKKAYSVDLWHPSFLLIIDLATADIREAATRCGFALCECALFRSAKNRYAFSVTGHRPRIDVVGAVPGLNVNVTEHEGMAVLTPTSGKRLPELKSKEIVVGGMVVMGSVLAGRSGLVLPMTLEECLEQCGPGSCHRLLADGSLVASDA